MPRGVARVGAAEGVGEDAGAAAMLPPDWRSLLRRRYALTATAAPSRFRPLDLAPHANRPLNYRKGWLGDLPLRYPWTGAQVVHGVPFQVPGGRARTQPGAVVFRSAINQTGSRRPLPDRLRLEVGEQARAVYFLHGCGFAHVLSRFATYGFYSGRVLLGETGLVALGQPPPGEESGEGWRGADGANIQDWWPDVPQPDFPSAWRVPVPDGESEADASRHVCLYTLEWKNPTPERRLTHIVIEVDAEQTTTLGLLGVSVLRPVAE